MKQKRKTKKLENSKGITLIALVVTIVILIILAAVTINIVLGENGIMQKATDAKADTIIGSEKEEIALSYNSAKIKTLGDSIIASDLQAELDSIAGAGKTVVTAKGSNGILNVYFNETQHSYDVDGGKIVLEESDEIETPTTFDASYDISEAGDGSVIAYLVENETEVLIIGEGKIKDYSNTVYDGEVSPLTYRYKIETVKISKGVTHIGDWLFLSCDGIKSVTIPESVTTIGARAFSECTGLTSVAIPKSVNIIKEGAFYECNSLSTVEYKGTKTQWNSINIENNNENLVCAETIKCVDGIIGVIEPPTTFEESYDISAAGDGSIIAYLVESETTGYYDVLITGNGEINDYEYSEVDESKNSPFCNMNTIKNVKVSKGITKIGDNLFYNCTELTSIKVPNTLNEIGDGAVYNCTSLQILEYEGLFSQFDVIIGDNNDVFMNVTLKCKDETIEPS